MDYTKSSLNTQVFLQSSITPFQAAKWLHVSVLLSGKELCQLLQALKVFQAVSWKNPVAEDKLSIGIDEIVDKCQALDAFWGEKTSSCSFPKFFPVCFSHHASFTVKKHTQEYLMQPIEPILLMKMHTLCFDKRSQLWRSHVLSQDTIFAGYTFSYPTIYYDEKQKRMETKPALFRNQLLWQYFRHWIRKSTTAFAKDRLENSFRKGNHTSCTLEQLLKES